MPTPDRAPSAAHFEKILPIMLIQAAQSGWTDRNYQFSLHEAGLSETEAATSFPEGVRTLVTQHLNATVTAIATGLASTDMTSMRIRDKVTTGARLWFETLSEHHDANIRALDWATARPTGPVPMTELIWQVADAIWTGIGDHASGFTYMSKRLTLSAVIGSTLTVWRNGYDDATGWSAFLDRRISDVMAFEKFKARFRIPLPA